MQFVLFDSELYKFLKEYVKQKECFLKDLKRMSQLRLCCSLDL